MIRAAAAALVLILLRSATIAGLPAGLTDVRVGASAVNLKCDPSMVLAGMIEARYTSEQEGELRAVAVVVEKAGVKLGIVACDVLWIPRSIVDACLAEIQRTTGIPPQNVLVNATHTHHAPSTAPAHGFGVSLPFRDELQRAVIRAVQEANRNLAGGEASFFFSLGEEKTIGANSRLKLPDGNITWLNPAREAGAGGVPTGPFDPQLPVLDFRGADGKSRALIFNHSTHTIGTRRGKDIRSPGFYGLAAQELEKQRGGIVSFLEGASGSTHNITLVPVGEAVNRLKAAVMTACSQGTRHPVDQLAATRRTLKFHVRRFDDSAEDAKIVRYTDRYAPASTARIREVFAAMRKKLKDQQGQERETYVQALRIGDVALVGVPAEYFTGLGVNIKRRSPFKHTYVAELANDWIGYLPDREAHRLGGYQTWMGLHSYAEEGTGERVADLAVELLSELAKQQPQIEKTTTSGRRTPQEEQRSFALADPKLAIELVVAEPQVTSPVALAWDADGSLFVAEMGGYPVTQKKGRIKRLGSAGDGRYEEPTIFADGLNFPATIMPYRDGVLTIDAPDLLFLRDADGDGKADERRVLWTGFIPGSQQLRANALHWGLDNWIYGANGRCDGEIRDARNPAGAAVSIRGRDFRFRFPAGLDAQGEFASIAGQSQFGQCHDDWGRRFLSWNVIPVRQAVIPEPYATSRASLLPRAVIDIASADDTGRVYPLSPPPRQFNAERADYYNAMCGLTIFRGDALGEAYRGNGFVGESLSNLVTRRVLRRKGVSLASERTERNQEFLAAADPWFHPVFLATGPDGALYVADFYREYVEHPLYVASEAIRQRIPWGNGSENGRLWRIRRRDAAIPGDRHPRLSRATTGELVAALSHPVGWWRDTAQRILVERGDRAAIPLLEAIVRDGREPLAVVHALWTLDGLAATNDKLLAAAVHSEEPSVRVQAIAIAETNPARLGKLLPQLAELLDDPDDEVRFRLALALGLLPADEVRLQALVGLARGAADPLILAAVLSSAAGQSGGLITMLSAIEPGMLSSANPATLQFLLGAGEQTARELDGQARAAFAEWCAGDRSQQASSIESGRLMLLAGMSRSGDPLASLSALHRDQVIKGALAGARDPSRPAVVRKSTLGLLKFAPPAQAAELLVGLLSGNQSAEMRTAAAETLADLNDVAGCRVAYGGWERFAGDVRRAVIAASGRSPRASAALLDAVEQDVVRPIEVPIDVLEQLKRSASKDVAARIARLFKAPASGNRSAVVERYRPALGQAGDPQRGAVVFRDNCISCHTIQRFGREVGPELSGLSSRAPELLLHDILDPSARIAADFINYVLITNSGTSFEGLLVAQGGDTVRLRRAQAEEIAVRSDSIEQLRASTKSLMPEGFETRIGPAAMADLLAFLRQPSRELLQAAPSVDPQQLKATGH